MILRWIKEIFYKEPLNYAEFIPHWGFIAPHTVNSQGATAHTGMTEYSYGTTMGPMTHLPWETRDEKGVSGAAKYLVEKYQVNATIEPHFNAYDKKVSGYEILALKGDSLSIMWAYTFLSKFQEAYPNRKNRGVKLVRLGDRGYRNLKDAKDSGVTVALLPELFFGDSKEDYLSIPEQASFWRNNCGGYINHQLDPSAIYH